MTEQFSDRDFEHLLKDIVEQRPLTKKEKKDLFVMGIFEVISGGDLLEREYIADYFDEGEHTIRNESRIEMAHEWLLTQQSKIRRAAEETFEDVDRKAEREDFI